MRNWEVMSSSMVNWVSETEILIKDQIFKQGLFWMRVVFYKYFVVEFKILYLKVF